MFALYASDAPRMQLLVLTLLAALLLFGNLHQGDLSGYDDAVYAHEGKQMLQNGDWRTVRLNGRLDFDKPPLFIWLEAISFKIFGLSDWAAKFPAALLGFSTLLLVYAIARELTGNSWIANMSFIVLASTQYFLKYAMHAMTDVPFTFFFTLAIWCYVKTWRASSSWWIGCGCALAGCIMMRSILGLLALGVICLHLFIMRWFHHLRAKEIWIGLIIALGVPLVWFADQYNLYGHEFLTRHFAFTVENARSVDPVKHREWWRGLFEYPWLMLKLYWPWLPVLVIGFVTAMRESWRAAAPTQRLLVLWTIIVILPFCLIQHKVLRYILPAFPAFSILAGLTLYRWVKAQWQQAAFQCAAAMLFIVFLGVSLLPSYRLRAVDVRQLIPPIEQVNVPPQPVLLYVGGVPRWDYVHQFIWYSDQHYDLADDFSALSQHFNQANNPPVVVDHYTYEQQFSRQAHKLKILAQTPRFIAFRRNEETPLEVAENEKIANKR